LVSVCFANVQSDPVLDFFTGFAYGVGAKLAEDPAVCSADSKMVLADFEQGFAKIEHGIESLNIHEIEQGLLLWSNGVDMMSVALKDCGADHLSADITRIVADLQTADGALRLLAEELVNIIDNDVATLFSETITDFDEGKYYEAGGLTGNIVAILLNDNH
jgi:hypothetical protein